MCCQDLLKKLDVTLSAMHVMRSINDDIHTYSLIITSWKMCFTLKPSLNPVAWMPLKLSIAQIFPSVINSLIAVR